MALKILYRSHNNTYFDLDDAAFDQINYIPGTTNNDILSTDEYRGAIGVLGGSIAGLAGAGLVGKADNTKAPLGWYVNDAQGAPFDNSPTVASEKGVFIHGDCMIQIDVYETHEEQATPTPLAAYAAGDILYTSVNGLATKEAPGGGNNVDTTPIGRVVDVPTSENPFLTILSLI